MLSYFNLKVIYIFIVFLSLSQISFGEDYFGDLKNYEIQNAIIIKSRLNKEDLKKIINKNISMIAELKDTKLYLVKSNNPIKEAKQYEKLNEVIYAQSDIIQKRYKARKKVEEKVIKYKYSENISKGKKVKIAVIDDGFNLNHEDLDEINIGFTYNVDEKNFDVYPKKYDTHGTKIIGIIFAEDNGSGITGIAPKSELIAIRQTINRTSDVVIAFYTAKLAGAEIINCSWNSEKLLEPVKDIIVDIAIHGRDSKGLPIVFSAGNSGKIVKDIEASIEEVITVGALKNGRIAPYSNFGQKVDYYIEAKTKTTNNEGYSLFGGTSAAAAQITGIIANIISEDKELKLSEILEKLDRMSHGNR